VDGPPPTSDGSKGFGRRCDRVQRGRAGHPGSGKASLCHLRRTLSSGPFGRSAPWSGHDVPITTTDSSAVGQGTSDVGRLGAGGRSVVFGRQARSNSFAIVRRATKLVGPGSGKWILRAGSAEGGQEPRGDVRNPTSPSRLEGERTGDGMSILEGGCKAMRGINQARNGPGNLRAGTRQGPY
jgi:hypothetical protein